MKQLIEFDSVEQAREYSDPNSKYRMMNADYLSAILGKCKLYKYIKHLDDDESEILVGKLMDGSSVFDFDPKSDLGAGNRDYITTLKEEAVPFGDFSKEEVQARIGIAEAQIYQYVEYVEYPYENVSLVNFNTAKGFITTKLAKSGMLVIDLKDDLPTPASITFWAKRDGYADYNLTSPKMVQAATKYHHKVKTAPLGSTVEARISYPNVDMSFG